MVAGAGISKNSEFMYKDDGLHYLSNIQLPFIPLGFRKKPLEQRGGARDLAHAAFDTENVAQFAPALFVVGI